MSRFADKLKNALQVAPPSMGFFRAAQVSAKPRMLLVAWIGLEEVEKSIDLLKTADAAVLVPSKTPVAKTLKALTKSLGEMPWGLWSEGEGPTFKALETAGVDFIVFAPDKMPLVSIGEEKPGRVVGIPLDLEDSLVRTINELPVDAVIINSPGTDPLTWKDLMRFRRLGDWISKPLLAVIPAPITEGEIKALWDAGIDALVVSLTAENQAGFKELKVTLDGMTLTAKRKWMKTRAIVPSMRQEEPVHDHEPDEGGDGDDE
jgi:cyanate lyase